MRGKSSGRARTRPRRRFVGCRRANPLPGPQDRRRPGGAPRPRRGNRSRRAAAEGGGGRARRCRVSRRCGSTSRTATPSGRHPTGRPVLMAAVRDAADRLGRRTGLAPERLVLGGRSMGGRMCSMVVGAPTADDDPPPALGSPAPRVPAPSRGPSREDPRRALPPLARAVPLRERDARRARGARRAPRRRRARSRVGCSSTGSRAPTTGTDRSRRAARRSTTCSARPRGCRRSGCSRLR